MGDWAFDHPCNRQEAPYPDALADIVGQLHFMPGFSFELGDVDRDVDRGDGGRVLARGLTLSILVRLPDAYHPERQRSVVHYFPVPAATYDRRSWRRWALNRCIDVLVHEACEAFDEGGERPFAPNHGPGRDPYTVFEYATDEERRTSFRGDLKPPDPNTGHGHVRPRPDGVKARCGGPGICAECSREAAARLREAAIRLAGE